MSGLDIGGRRYWAAGEELKSSIGGDIALVLAKSGFPRGDTELPSLHGVKAGVVCSEAAAKTRERDLGLGND